MGLCGQIRLNLLGQGHGLLCVCQRLLQIVHAQIDAGPPHVGRHPTGRVRFQGQDLIIVGQGRVRLANGPQGIGPAQQGGEQIRLPLQGGRKAAAASFSSPRPARPSPRAV